MPACASAAFSDAGVKSSPFPAARTATAAGSATDGVVGFGNTAACSPSSLHVPRLNGPYQRMAADAF